MPENYIARELIFPNQDEVVYLAEDYEQLQKTNQELLEALEDAIDLLASAEIQDSVRVRGMTKIIRDGYKVLTNAKQAGGR